MAERAIGRRLLSQESSSAARVSPATSTALRDGGKVQGAGSGSLKGHIATKFLAGGVSRCFSEVSGEGPKELIHGGGRLGHLAHPYSRGFGPRLSRQLAHLDRHLKHLWGSNPRELGFRGGWRKEELREVKAAAEEWPRLGIGGGESRWTGTIKGDTRRFEKVVRGRIPAMAQQGGGWRGRFQPRPAFHGRRPLGVEHHGRQGQEGVRAVHPLPGRAEEKRDEQVSAVATKEGSLVQQIKPMQMQEKTEVGITVSNLKQDEAKAEVAASRPPPQANPRHGMNPNSHRIFCVRCKGVGHLVKDCHVAVFCVNCAKPTHKTKDCLYDKQPRPIAKLVRYGAPGLGCILIQNTRSEPAKEHINPLAMISIISRGGLTVAQLEQGFTQQFKWNWIWKAKEIPNGTFQMRFPNRMRFDELSNFDHFTVKGTNVQVNVKEWTQEPEAVGKMHTVWARVTGIPDEMKTYPAPFEVGSNLGLVMEVDMITFRAKGLIRIKVGMMDLEALPLKLILTTPKGLLFQAQYTLEEVVEQGWFREQVFEEDKEAVYTPTKVG